MYIEPKIDSILGVFERHDKRNAAKLHRRHKELHYVGITNLLEILDSGADLEDYDDHTRLLAGGLLLGLNLQRTGGSGILNAKMPFQERDL